MKPKSINSLMAYMSDEKKINIYGSLQKRQLRNMGYYHGYKGYRYCGSPNQILLYTDFKQIKAVYDFDMKIKSIFYPQIMFLETTIKNYSLEIILNEVNSDRFVDVYTKLMNNYKSYPFNSKKYKIAITKKMSMRNKIYGNIARDYGKNNIIKHYYDKDKPVPIWAIFEILSLGEFGNFFSCLNKTVRIKISKSVGIKSSVDSNGEMIENIVFALKDLRNAIAHNNTIFDTRFKSNKINGVISKYISMETGIKNINFQNITDYLILISFVMKLLKCNRTDIIALINQFNNECEDLRKQIPMNIFSKIVYTDTKGKLRDLKNFL